MASPTTAAASSQAVLRPELADELREAERDFSHGDFVDVTVEQLDRCMAAGEWPWPEESSE